MKKKHIIRIFIIVLIGFVVGAFLYYRLVNRNDELMVVLMSLVTILIVIIGMAFNVWQIQKTTDIQKQLSFYRIGFLSLFVMLSIGWVTLFYLVIPPYKYWFTRPTNFSECFEATDGRTRGLFPYLGQECRFRGTVYSYTWADWAAQFNNPINNQNQTAPLEVS